MLTIRHRLPQSEDTARVVVARHGGEIGDESRHLIGPGGIAGRDCGWTDLVAGPLDRERAGEVLKRGARRLGVLPGTWRGSNEHELAAVVGLDQRARRRRPRGDPGAVDGRA